MICGVIVSLQIVIRLVLLLLTN